MIRNILGLTLTLACCLATTGAAPAPLPAASLAQSYSRLGFDLLRELRAERPGTNVFISPASVAVALAMAANGADGPTRTAILSTLHINGWSMASVNAANRTLASEIAQTTAVRLTMANALWLQTGFTIRPQFANTLHATFGAQASNLNFRDSGSVDTVNAWAKQHTDGMIPKVLASIDPSTVLMLANAIAFKGMWSSPFPLSATAKHDFTNASGVTSVEMMSASGKYRYAQNGSEQIIALPYADGSFAMYVILPESAAAFDTLVNGVTPASFDALTGTLQMRSGTIQLPRFSVSYDASLNRALTKLGMGVAFTPAANFTNIHGLPPPLAIGNVQHASFLQVDEKGTKAAAATTVGFKMLAIREEPPPFQMLVDRPFLVAIRDERSEQLLFLGTIVRP